MHYKTSNWFNNLHVLSIILFTLFFYYWPIKSGAFLHFTDLIIAHRCWLNLLRREIVFIHRETVLVCTWSQGQSLPGNSGLFIIWTCTLFVEQGRSSIYRLGDLSTVGLLPSRVVSGHSHGLCLSRKWQDKYCGTVMIYSGHQALMLCRRQEEIKWEVCNIYNSKTE